MNLSLETVVGSGISRVRLVYLNMVLFSRDDEAAWEAANACG